MAKFERYTAFNFQLLPTREQQILLAKHVGAARFAFNAGLRQVKDQLDTKKGDSSIKICWSSYDLINWFNAFKVSAEAGTDDEGNPGLAWRREITAQAFEESLVDLADGFKAYWDSRKGKRKGRKVGFPRFRRKGRRDTFRLRNRKNAIRVGGPGDPKRAIRLGKKFGVIRVRQDTRRLRQLVAKSRGQIKFVTVEYDAGKWWVRINVAAAPFHDNVSGSRQAGKQVVGIDRGLTAFAVGAHADGNEAFRYTSPKPLSSRLEHLRKLSRRVSLSKKGGKNRRKKCARLQRCHRKLRNQRQTFLHQVTSRVVKNHDCIVLEDLHVAGMLRNRRLARHIADSAWSEFGRQLKYKAQWYGATVLEAPRFFPSSQLCSTCDAPNGKQPLEVREFVCTRCHQRADRDTNAAANLAKWAHSPGILTQPPVSHRGAMLSEGRSAADLPVSNFSPSSGEAPPTLRVQEEPSHEGAPEKGDVDMLNVNRL